MIPNEVIEQIRDYDLVSILKAEGLELKKEGATYKCCCPFHNEKTPSFVVSASRNLAHCFGSCSRSWDAIAFVQQKHGMNFYEAVEYLAAMLNIHYEKVEPTPEEREEQYKREQIRSINLAAQEWFRQRLAASPAARGYCKDRGWKEETLELFGVGYAPADGGLYSYLKRKGWQRGQILDAGLCGISEVSGEPYDTFRERIVFPIWSKTGYIAGFTGRYIGDKEDIAKRMKYVNTRETELFRKGDMLFGWYQAARRITTTGTAVLCEGNPDVLRLHQIGVAGAIAPCGTALTEENVAYLKSKAREVILAGDMDDAGRESVRKEGEALLKAGLSVRVMEWDRERGKDPDEFFLKNPKGWDEALSLDTVDFLPWICRKELEGKSSQTEIAAAIDTVAGLLAYVKDENAAEMYITRFSKEWKYPKVWNSAYYKAKNALERSAVAKDTKAQDMLRDYGFYIRKNCYYGAASGSSDKRWSNFILVPVLHIRDEKNAKRIYRIVNEKNQESVIKFAQSEMVSFADFKTRVETAGNYIWEVSAAELTSLKRQLYDDTPSADEIRQLGWQKRWGFYAWGNGGLDAGTFVKADKYGIVDLKGGKFYLPGCAADTAANTQGYQIERRFIYQVTNDITLKDYAGKLIDVFGDNAKVGLCFLLATLFKDIVTGITVSFPILNLFGPKGTGKSALGHSLTAFFIQDNKAPNISNSTKAALAEAVAEVSNAIVHLDEYKNDIDPDKREFLKGLWDGTGRSRMNMDNDKKRETTAVDCGVVMSGQEMPTADIALFNRLVFLTFSKTVFSDAEKQAYEELKRTERRGLTHLTAEILKLRPQFQGGFRSAWDDTMTDLSRNTRAYGLEDRTLANWCTVLAAFRTLESSLGLPFDYREMLRIVTSMCIDQNNKTRQSSELSGFWESLETLVASSKMWIKADYHIREGGRPLKLKESSRAGNDFIPNPDKRYLLINFKRAASLYQKEGRAASGRTIPSDSLKYYLEHSYEYIGTCEKVKFKLIDNQLGYTPSDDAQTKWKVTTAMVFDYDALKDHYGISLDISTGYSDEDMEALRNIGGVSDSSGDNEAPGIFDD